MSYASLTILVLDDDISVRTMIVKQLEMLGVGAAMPVSTYKEAMEVVGCAHFDGAFLDLVLQRSSGLDVGHLLSKHNVPCVFYTAISDDFNTQQMLELGWVLTKPVRLAGLRRALDWFKCAKYRCEAEPCEARK